LVRRFKKEIFFSGSPKKWITTNRSYRDNELTTASIFDVLHTNQKLKKRVGFSGDWNGFLNNSFYKGLLK